MESKKREGDMKKNKESKKRREEVRDMAVKRRVDKDHVLYLPGPLTEHRRTSPRRSLPQATDLTTR